MYSHPLHNDPNLETVYTLCERKAQIALDIKSAKRELKKARTPANGRAQMPQARAETAGLCDIVGCHRDERTGGL